ncbi:hypothetical protein JCM30204_43380 [Dysgonomonas termitidis]
MNLGARNIITYSNVESGEFGVKKEYVSINKETSKPESKGYYHYDRKGNIVEKTVSIWNDEKGWENLVTYTYQYGDANKVTYITCTRWDKDNARWSEKSDVTVHIYNDKDEFLTTKRVQVENKAAFDLVSQK